MIFRHFYHFLPEESGKLGYHSSAIQVTLSLTHDNRYVVDSRILIFFAYIRVSHSMVVLYIRDHEGLGFSGQKNQSKTSPTIP